MSEDWRNNPQLAGMDKTKLDMLQNLATQGSSKGINDMLLFLWVQLPRAGKAA